MDKHGRDARKGKCPQAVSCFEIQGMPENPSHSTHVRTHPMTSHVSALGGVLQAPEDIGRWGRTGKCDGAFHAPLAPPGRPLFVRAVASLMKKPNPETIPMSTAAERHAYDTASAEARRIYEADGKTPAWQAAAGRSALAYREWKDKVDEYQGRRSAKRRPAPPQAATAR